jgi:hypothetical protein
MARTSSALRRHAGPSGVELGVAAVAKFNEVSERVGFPDRIVVSATVAAHNFDQKRDVACTKGEYVSLVNNSRRYEYLRDHMRRMPLGEAGTRHFFDQPGTVSFQEAVDEARSVPSDGGSARNG